MTARGIWPSHQTRPARQLHSHPRLPRQNEPFAGTARPPARAKPNPAPPPPKFARCVHEQDKPPSDPGLAEKGEPKGNKKRARRIFGGAAPQKLRVEFPLGPDQSSQFNVISSELARPPRKFHSCVVRYLPAYSSAQFRFPNDKTNPSTPTGSRAAAELHPDTASPWARHSLSPLSRRYVFSSPASPEPPRRLACCCAGRSLGLLRTRATVPRLPLLGRIRGTLLACHASSGPPGHFCSAIGFCISRCGRSADAVEPLSPGFPWGFLPSFRVDR